MTKLIPLRSWNPVTGCDKIYPGCKNCIAERIINLLKNSRNPEVAYRYRNGFKAIYHYDDQAVKLKVWSPSIVQVVTLGDLFNWKIGNLHIKYVFGRIHWATQHYYLILTRNILRLKVLFFSNVISFRMNQWIGVSIEDGSQMDKVLHLQQIPFPNRYLVFQPLLGPIDLYQYIQPGYIKFAIVGLESGPDARIPALDDLFRLINDLQLMDIPVMANNLPLIKRAYGSLLTTEHLNHLSKLATQAEIQAIITKK